MRVGKKKLQSSWSRYIFGSSEAVATVFLAFMGLAAIISAIISSGIYAERAKSPPAEQSSSSVVLLANKFEADEGVAGEDVCGAVVIKAGRSKSLALTAAHCFLEVGKITVETKEGLKFDATLLWKSDSNPVDLALVEINSPLIPPAEVSCENPPVGATVTTVGHPLGETWSHLSGTVAAIRGEHLQLNMSLLPGNSGGPIFDSEGRLVGIATSVRVFGSLFGMSLTSMARAQSAETICRYLGKAVE